MQSDRILYARSSVFMDTGVVLKMIQGCNAAIQRLIEPEDSSAAENPQSGGGWFAVFKTAFWVAVAIALPIVMGRLN